MGISVARWGATAGVAIIVAGCGGATPMPTPPRVNQFAYVAAPTDRNLSWYSVADGNGRLRPEGYLEGVARASRVDLLDAQRLIITDGDNTIASYSRNLTNGRPRLLGLVRDVNHFAISPLGDLVVASKPTGQGVAAYRISSAGVDATPVGSVPMPLATQLTTLFYHPSGRWVYGPKGAALTRLAVDASATVPITLMSDAFTDPTGETPQSVVFDPGGSHAYIVFGSRIVVADVSLQDGSMSARLSPVQMGPLSEPRFHPSGGWLFAIEQGAVKAWRIDPTTFLPNMTMPPSRVGVGVGGYNWSAAGDLVTMTSPNRTIEGYRFDVTTGAFTPAAYRYDGWAHGALALSAGSSYARKSELVALVINKADSSIQSFKVIADGTLSAVSTLPSGGTSPSALAVSPLDPFVYVAHSGSGNVSAFSVNTTSGALTAVGAPVPVGADPEAITTEPSGRFVFVANATDGTISMLDINPATGELSAGSHVAKVTAAARPAALAADPNGRLLYVGASVQSGPAVEAFLVQGGQLSSSTMLNGNSPGAFASALALRTDAYGELLLSTHSGQAQTLGHCPIVGAAPNCAGQLATVPGPLGSRSIAIDDLRRRAFALGNVPNNPLFCVLPYSYGTYSSGGTSNLTPVQTRTTLSSIFTNPVQLVSSYSGDWQYIVEQARNRIALFDVDAHNELTLRSSFPTGNGPVAMAFVLATE